MPEVATALRQALDAAAARLADTGVPDPRREAVALWTDLYGTGRLARALDRADTVADDLRRFGEAVERRAAGMPRAHASGVAGFRRLLLVSDFRGLIPRPETEGLVDLALRLAPAGRALDLGTGSGCLALALADEGHYRDVTAVDRSAEALALARENGHRTGLQVRWLAGDWCAPVAGERFDLVVSNPPYLTRDEVTATEPSVRDWEPVAALDGGPDGLDPYRALFRQVPEVLAPGGVLALEIDARRGGDTARLAREAGWTAITIQQDLFGRDRYLTARRETRHA